MSRQGNRMCFTCAAEGAYFFYAVGMGAEGELGHPRLLHSGPDIILSAACSADGSHAVVLAGVPGGMLEFGLRSFDAATGHPTVELWAKGGISADPPRFSPVRGDQRLATSSLETGIERVFIWDAARGERTRLDLDIRGAQSVCDWSPDGTRLLVAGLERAVQSLYEVDINKARSRKLDSSRRPLSVLSGRGGERHFGLERLIPCFACHRYRRGHRTNDTDHSWRGRDPGRQGDEVS
jgi:hypothetical protein